jgi:streptogramin lyase
MGMRMFLAVLAIASASAACGAGGSSGDGGCNLATCTTSCLASGFSAGSCAGGTCTCRGSDGGTDADSSAETSAEADADADARPDTGPPGVESYIWIANTAEGTLSKVDTIRAIEVARYLTGPNAAGNDPSRTSVNLHGDMVVTNRNVNGLPGGSSSTAKFAANIEDCVDRNGNATIETSSGPTDVLPWGEDECMLWSTPIGPPYGARATVWDGEEDPETGRGGHVWIGTCTFGMGTNTVYKLDGDTGEILEQTTVPASCAYGGAVDGAGGLWIVDNFVPDAVIRVDMVTLATERHPINLCGYGISVDSRGRVWTGGDLCINRFDPAAGTDQQANVAAVCPGCTMLRGIAVGSGKSAGFVWAADSSGNLVKIDEESVEVVEAFRIGTPDMIGVAVDFEGYVWAVSQGGNAAYKFDPDAETFVTVGIGAGPYTYSDMTGVQLRQVIII